MATYTPFAGIVMLARCDDTSVTLYVALGLAVLADRTAIG
jgi:hypothetical protein